MSKQSNNSDNEKNGKSINPKQKLFICTNLFTCPIKQCMFKNTFQYQEEPISSDGVKITDACLRNNLKPDIICLFEGNISYGWSFKEELAQQMQYHPNSVVYRPKFIKVKRNWRKNKEEE